MDILTSFGIPALVGVGVGILSGMLGIGGGTVLVPIFRLGFHLSPIMSTATSLFTIVPTAISGGASHIRHKTCIPSLGVAMGLGGALTSPVGVWLASISPAWLVMLVAALIIGYAAFNIIRKAWKLKPPQDGPARAEGGKAAARAAAIEKVLEAETLGEADAADSEQPGAAAGLAASTPRAASGGIAAEGGRSFPKLSLRQLVSGALIGLGAGVASGYVGVGGGFIMVPLMLGVVGVSMRQATGTSLVAMMILSIPGTVSQALLGNIAYVAGIAIVIGSIPGAVIGAKIVRVIPERLLHFIFGGFLIAAAVVLALNEFGILT